jgi:hypothetical protein
LWLTEGWRGKEKEDINNSLQGAKGMGHVFRDVHNYMIPQESYKSPSLEVVPVQDPHSQDIKEERT